MKHENLVLSKELIKVELLSCKIWKADVSSVSPSSERIENCSLLLLFMRFHFLYNQQQPTIPLFALTKG